MRSGDESTNIFTNIFKSSILKINPEVKEDVIYRNLQDIELLLENEDLGQAFYDR